MKKLLLLASMCLAFGLVGAGCGDDDDSGDGGGGGAADTAAETQATDDTSAGQDAAQVSMKDIEFNPTSVTVKTGGEVTWTNDDSAAHDVTADDDSFKSGEPGGMDQGAKFTHKFTQAGTFKYVCTVHPGMEGTVVVQ